MVFVVGCRGQGDDRVLTPMEALRRENQALLGEVQRLQIRVDELVTKARTHRSILAIVARSGWPSKRGGSF